MSEFGQKSKRGRPKKKPEYNKEENVNELLSQAVTLFGVPFDDREARPPDAPTIAFVAEKMNTSRMRVRKLLITAGVFSTALSRQIWDMHQDGATLLEICEKTGLAKSAVKSYLPYLKGIYKLKDPTLNAEQCQLWQWRKHSCERLKANLENDEWSEYLWDAVCAFSKYNFRHIDQERCRYEVDGEKLCFGDYTVHRNELECAFQKARTLQKTGGCGKGCCCHKKLCAVFLRIGVCCKSVQNS